MAKKPEMQRPGGVISDTEEVLHDAREMLDKIEAMQLLDRAEKLLARVEKFWLFRWLGL